MTTSILIDPDLREEAKKRGIKLSYLIERGWQSIQEETGASERLKDAEDTILKLQGMITTINTRYLDLKDSINQVTK